MKHTLREGATMAFEHSNPKDLIRTTASVGAHYTTDFLSADLGAVVTNDIQTLPAMILDDMGVHVDILFSHPTPITIDPQDDIGVINVSATIHKKVLADWLETQQGV